MIEFWKSRRPSEDTTLDLFQSSENLSGCIGQTVPYDIVFLDVQFPSELDGITLAHSLRNWSDEMVIVFISDYAQYAVDGYYVNAFRYLKKPPKESDIRECLDVTYHRLSEAMDTKIIIQDRDTAILESRRVLYIESRGHYSVFHMVDGNERQFRKKLSDILRHVPPVITTSVFEKTLFVPETDYSVPDPVILLWM